MSRLRLKAAGHDEWLEFDFTLDSKGHFTWEDQGLVMRGKVVAPATGGGQAEGWLDVDGRITPFVACRVKNRVHVWAGGDMVWLELASPGATTKAVPLAAGDEVAAPMPGTVLKVLVEPGVEVKAHQPMLVMESMKMELTLHAPRDGKVAKVMCSEGALVEMGVALARLEPQA